MSEKSKMSKEEQASDIMCELTDKLAKVKTDEEADRVVSEHLTGDPEIDRLVVGRLHVLDLLKMHQRRSSA